MKKLFLTSFAFILFVGFTNAQDDSSTEDFTSKGTYIVGGSSNLSIASNSSKTKTDTQEVDTGSTFNISFAPAAGYFVMDNLVTGIQLSIGYRKFKDDNSSVTGDIYESKTTTLLALPFVRYYFSKNNIKPFLQGSVGLGTSKTKFTNTSPFSEGENESTSNIFAYEFDGGVAIFINSNISVDLGIGYASTSSKPKDSSSDLKFINNAIGFNAGFNIYL